MNLGVNIFIGSKEKGIFNKASRVCFIKWNLPLGLERRSDSLSILKRQKFAQKIAWVLKAVQEIEKVPKTYFKKLSDTDFYEVRIELSGNIYRLLGFFYNGNIVILTNGFQKKTQKTPKSEIEVCEARMKDFLTRSKKNGK